MHVNVLVSVGPTLLVHEAEGVQKLVHDNLQVDAAVLLQSDLHSASPGSVGNLSIAASAPRHDVHVVVLVRPGHEPEHLIVKDQQTLLSPSLTEYNCSPPRE